MIFLFFLELTELQQMSTRLKTYSYSELKKATNDFNENNLLGQGGFGPVYKVSKLLVFSQTLRILVLILDCGV